MVAEMGPTYFRKEKNRIFISWSALEVHFEILKNNFSREAIYEKNCQKVQIGSFAYRSES